MRFIFDEKSHDFIDNKTGLHYAISDIVSILNAMDNPEENNRLFETYKNIIEDLWK
jgi:hypothetical protein